MPAKNRSRNLVALFAGAILLFSGCAKQAEITLPAVEGFFTLSGAPGKTLKECDKYFRKELKEALKARTPDVLEKAYQYSGKTVYTQWELRGIVRCAIIELAGKVKTMEEAKTAVSLLEPSLQDMGADRTGSYARLKAAADPGAFTGLLKPMVGELTEVCLKEIDTLRSADPGAAEKRLMDLRYLLLALPEGESEVVNITRIVWDELNSDVNDIQIDKVRELLRGAYPALVL